ncbi:uncharacterized protein LOC110052165 isoform X1 [Orbicella faveolata]|uniref:uncharacterized protein LOC110052165 isoform X1 n=1 Tax=Orbicella faveolata TaxID=48498 RepID=UPI0009E53166|nr:uncharacterized protein LOC110052165 isoform X1 [Orbicella faveolata]
MDTCAFLSFILVALQEIIFSSCEGLNSSSSTTFSGSLGLTTRTSHSSSSPWCLRCASSVKSSMASSLISPNQPSIQPDRTKYSTRSLASITTVVTPTRQLIDSTTQPAQRLSPTAARLTSFGIFLITFGGVLVAFMMVSLIWICSGRERSPEAPHSQVKLKPWSHPPDRKVDDIPPDASDLPKSYQNQGLNSSSPNSPSTPNVDIGRTTEKFSESPVI